MKIAVLKERVAGELRVAVSPETVKKFIELGAEIHIQAGAGTGADIPDSAFKDAGATLHNDTEKVLENADILLKVQSFSDDNSLLDSLKKDAIIVGFLDPFGKKDHIEHYANRNLTSFSVEMIPRISRAQSMDALSSQSNLAGYRSVIDAVAEFGRVVPMMMTAAGTIPPARALVLGAGVAGLQAIATVKRLGAIVSAFDVRPAVKEQVESLGASFVEVDSAETESAETKGGYAKEMSDDYKKRQEAKIHDVCKKQDIVISTALIPGRPAPVLITEAMVKDMKPGSVIVDMAVSSGGNCPLSVLGKVVRKHDVIIIGYDNFPSRVAHNASLLYAKNVLNFVTLLIDKEKKSIVINTDDEIIAKSLLTHEGKVVHPLLSKEAAA